MFALKGIPGISLERKSTTPHSRLALGKTNGKIPFQLTINIAEVSDKESKVQLLFKRDFDPVMVMMVKIPISRLIEALVTKMKDL